MGKQIREGEVLWRPSAADLARANLTHYMRWLEQERGLSFADYHQLWEWSTREIESFWQSMWDYFAIKASRPFARVLDQPRMPGADWFAGATLNYADHVFRQQSEGRPALLFQSETVPLCEVSWSELAARVASLAAWLRSVGVVPGDRVVAYLPNIPETVMMFLACAAVGAVWSSCSPDFAGRSVLDRFSQIEPKVLVAIDRYRYGGRDFDCRPALQKIMASLPSLEQTVLVPNPGSRKAAELAGTLPWSEVSQGRHQLVFEQLPFSHPMWVVYSSGTTGMPKGLVHGQGGILLELLKFLTFHADLHPGEVFFWFSTTGWVMWNIVQGGLLTGATPVLFDGNPAHLGLDTLWRMAQEAGVTMFGTSAAFIGACLQAGLRPGRDHDLSRLRSVGSTGSPLSPQGFAWVYREVKQDILLGSTSGGTDVCSGFLGACPLLPVRAGELQCRCLGVKAEAWDEAGRAVVGQVGELVISQPMPSMPLYLWNDPDGKRYQESYFSLYPGAWRHGDWIKITPHQGCVILGRSDSTLNRQGVRMGSSDFYRVVEEMDGVADSLIVGYSDPGGQYRMPLFLVMQEETLLDDDFKKQVVQKLRSSLSPRHVPDGIFAIPQVPRTLNGKKLEVPIIKILAGQAPEEAVNRDSMANPESIDFFVQFARNPPW